MIFGFLFTVHETVQMHIKITCLGYHNTRSCVGKKILGEEAFFNSFPAEF